MEGVQPGGAAAAAGVQAGSVVLACCGVGVGGQGQGVRALPSMPLASGPWLTVRLAQGLIAIIKAQPPDAPIALVLMPPAANWQQVSGRFHCCDTQPDRPDHRAAPPSQNIKPKAR